MAGRRLNELFHCGPYEVKASKFLSFFALAASLPFNQPSWRQKMAPPSAFKPSPRQVSGFFLERGVGEGGGHWFPELGLPSASRGGQGCPACRVPPLWGVAPTWGPGTYWWQGAALAATCSRAAWESGAGVGQPLGPSAWPCTSQQECGLPTSPGRAEQSIHS